MRLVIAFGVGVLVGWWAHKSKSSSTSTASSDTLALQGVTAGSAGCAYT